MAALLRDARAHALLAGSTRQGRLRHLPASESGRLLPPAERRCWQNAPAPTTIVMECMCAH